MIQKIKKIWSIPSKEIWTKLQKKIERPLLRVISNGNLVRLLPDHIDSLVRKESPLGKVLKRGNQKNRENHAQQTLDYFRQREGLRFYGFVESKTNILAQLERYIPWGKEQVIQEADRICAHTFHFFDVDEYQFTNGIDWHMDFKTGKRWPIHFSQDIAYRGPTETGDIKYVWELSRHQYFLTLGKAYWYTGDERYAREFVSHVLSWIKANPPYQGVHWLSALEHGIRIISWIWAFYFFISSYHIDASFISLFLGSIWSQLRFIEKNLTSVRYANNHSIGEATGLFIGGLFLRDFIESEKWLKKSITILMTQIRFQTHPDGVNVEQAMSYQRFSMEFFILFKILYEQNLHSLPAHINECLEKMFEYLMYVIFPDGHAPSYGDSDDSRGIILSNGKQTDYRGIISIGAALFGRSDMKWVSQKMGEEVIWLLGNKGMETYQRILSESPKLCSILFPKGGYCILRDGWEKHSNYLLFDCGGLGHCSGAHGHADALSIQLFAMGTELLIDPGTYAYNQEPEFRNYFRATRAHNTITVDHKNQADISDRMSWENIPTSIIRDYYSTDEMDFISAENNGYNRLPHPVMHHRTIIFHKKPAYYLMIDQLKTIHDTKSHDYGLHFHFPPQSKIDCQESISVSVTPKQNILLFIHCSHPFEEEIKQADPEPMGWYSRKYGHKIGSPTLSFWSKTDGDILFLTFMAPYSQKRPVLSRFVGYKKDGAIFINLKCDEKEYQWIFNEFPKDIHYGNIIFCGKLAFMDKCLSHDPSFVYAIDCTKLNIHGQSCLDSIEPKSGYIMRNL